MIAKILNDFLEVSSTLILHRRAVRYGQKCSDKSLLLCRILLGPIFMAVDKDSIWISKTPFWLIFALSEHMDMFSCSPQKHFDKCLTWFLLQWYALKRKMEH